jgi:DNA-binding XRE family transcriptional regulator
VSGAAGAGDRLDGVRSGPFAIWPEHQRHANRLVAADAALASAQRAVELARVERANALRDALAAGMTQAQAARQLGVSRQRLGQLCAGLDSTSVQPVETEKKPQE